MKRGAVLVFALAAIPACAQRIEGQFERTLNVSGAVTLDVVTDAGGIRVTSGGTNTVQIRGILRSSRDWLRSERDVESRIRALEQNPPIEQNGNTIRAGYVRDHDLLRGVSMRLEIVTPADTRLHARADSGGIYVQGIKGPAECATDSGGIEALDVGGEVRAQADSGGIHIRNVAGPVYARADSGGIEAHEVAGALDLATDSGGIRASQNVAAPVRMRADSGGATLRLASTGGYDIHAVADSGRISTPEMTVRGTISPHRREGKVRGGGPLVDIQVDSGTVHIE